MAEAICEMETLETKLQWVTKWKDSIMYNYYMYTILCKNVEWKEAEKQLTN